ncbi:hypothetical protein ACIBQ1_20235 [Nonomuraea sp. NPDC050153]|uniref:hypothetical protein n=1 Tax=Nonomuraea sp. NPDC050153 TaxID=3364359 RepID=UPI0037AB3BE9
MSLSQETMTTQLLGLMEDQRLYISRLSGYTYVSLDGRCDHCFFQRSQINGESDSLGHITGASAAFLNRPEQVALRERWGTTVCFRPRQSESSGVGEIPAKFPFELDGVALQ